MQFVGAGRRVNQTYHPFHRPSSLLLKGRARDTAWRHDSREAGPSGLLQDVRQLLLVVQEVLLNVLPGLKGLGLALFLLHKILPDVLEVLGLHDAQPAAGLLQLPQGGLHVGLLPHEEAPHQDEQAQVLGLAEGPDDVVGAGRAGAGRHVPGDVVAQGRVEGGQDGVEEGLLGVGGGVLVLQVPSGGLHLASLALSFNHVAQEGLVPPGAVLHIPELELKEVDGQPLPVGRGGRATGGKRGR